MLRKESNIMASSEMYRCFSCGWSPATEEENKEYEHCPNCLSAVHEIDDDGDECGGVLEPVSIWVKPDESWSIIHRCNFCGEMHEAPLAEGDNPIKIMSIASKPLAQPPFPIERMETLTKMMGGKGSVGGYNHE